MMIDILLEVLVELIISPIGGALRWFLFRKKTLRDYVSDNWESNLLYFLLFVGGAIVVVVLVSQFCCGERGTRTFSCKPLKINN